MRKVDLFKKVVFINSFAVIMSLCPIGQCFASNNNYAGNDMNELSLTVITSDIGHVDEVNEAVNLELNKEYSANGFKFTVQVVRILKGSYPMGMFGGRPANPNLDPAYEGVLGIELTLTSGDSDKFSDLDKYIVHENGERNVKEDHVGIANNPTFKYLYNVPLSAKKIKFCIGGLELNLENVLNKSAE